ncbi:class I adenylate-forming enzyme family protein [Solibacillus sp. FSL K6-1523]|uniref:class I adenylate-forming enzyme family protein n=1 Tax=Solibacillus sp. FSL K6-1523 TaxID=2921471 RepID=UPI0030F7A02E
MEKLFNGNIIQGSVEHWAQVKPDEAAVIDENGNILKWGDWNEQSNLLAEALAEEGVTEGSTVGVRTQMRLEWFVINRALAKLGCKQVGVNYRLTPGEVKGILADSNAKVLISDDHLPSKLTKELSDVLHVNINEKEFLEIKNYEVIMSNATMKKRFSQMPNPPLIIYTSGTTGAPKGVFLSPEIRQQRAKEIQEYFADVFRMSVRMPTDLNLVTMPFHHSAGPAVSAAAHLVGEPVIILSKFDPERALQLIQEYKITNWTCVPTMIKRLSKLPQEVLNKYDVSSIKIVEVGAAPIPEATKRWAISHFGNCLVEGYGTSEVYMVSTMLPEMQLVKPASSGRMYNHAQVSIRDENNNALPIGEKGEIWVKTPMTIDRYYNREPLGLDTIDEKGFFRTGDIGYLDEEQYLYIADRSKDMIIRGGVNIYPAEIEAAIIKHPDVMDVAIIGIPHDDLGEEIKAFCHLNEGATLTAEELISFCKNELALYKNPSSIEFVDQLPYSAVGKILKRDLRDPFWKDKERSV